MCGICKNKNRMFHFNGKGMRSLSDISNNNEFSHFISFWKSRKEIAKPFLSTIKKKFFEDIFRHNKN